MRFLVKGSEDHYSRRRDCVTKRANKRTNKQMRLLLRCSRVMVRLITIRGPRCSRCTRSDLSLMCPAVPPIVDSLCGGVSPRSLPQCSEGIEDLPHELTRVSGEARLDDHQARILFRH